MSRVRLSRVEEERLLGRPVRSLLMPADRAWLRGRRVVVTGAGGSVGSELARQIADSAPALLVLLDHSEYALFKIEHELRSAHPALAVDAVLGDVTRRVDVRGACTPARPEVVYHAAAYKHVTLTERNIIPAIRTNVMGAFGAACAARDAGARFVLISSDKAAEPRSVMGATKRLAELVVLALASPSFRPIVVRFGNILGSSGSLVEIMQRCVEEGRSVPVTHPDATRYFMTAGEAVSLVLKADAMAQRAGVFWLDMGEPLRVGDLVDRFVDLACADRPRVGVNVIGLRPGEKMREELTSHGLAMRPTEHPSIWSARQRRIAGPLVADALRAVRRAAARGDARAALSAIETAVGDFTPSVAALTSARAALPAASTLRTRTRARDRGVRMGMPA